LAPKAHGEYAMMAENEYATKEAAFEAAIAAASLVLREGHEVTVTAPSSPTTTGASAK
jgi:hypothetical protein